MTNALFARQAAFLANLCSEWAGDTLSYPENELNNQVSVATVNRFAEQVQARLTRITDMALKDRK